ncbi:SOS response-associated peptidase [Mesoterricola silvestris]|nr:SOS response-associated peptidase [Mesoterricola silvestris]
MCGRYALSSPLESLEAQFEAEAQALWTPRYNIAPTTPVLVVRNGAAGRVIVLQRWGLVPSWSRDASMGARMANARAETVAEKPSFRGPFRRNRCILPADAFYEWRAGTPKQPFAIRPAGGGPLAFAGLWDRWEGPEGVLETCTILTTSANGAMAPIHDRMPVILAREDYGRWLDEGGTDLLRPCPDAWLQVHPVGPRVGNARNDDPTLLEPLDD